MLMKDGVGTPDEFEQRQFVQSDDFADRLVVADQSVDIAIRSLSEAARCRRCEADCIESLQSKRLAREIKRSLCD